MTDRNPQMTSSHELGLFGIETSQNSSDLLILPVPWEVTTSYGSGASLGPQCLLEASPQIDLYHRQFGEFYRKGIHLLTPPSEVIDQNQRLKPKAESIQKQWEKLGRLDKEGRRLLDEVNENSEQVMAAVYEQCRELLQNKPFMAVLGGDHSAPLGLIRALAEKYVGNDIGVLHLDAHADLRAAYQGFQHSHASIMRNVMNLSPGIAQLVQVGIRDYCKEEHDYMSQNEPRISCFFDCDLKGGLFRGHSWEELCDKIISQLPEYVYISFDIDGLSPDLCPGTGTPVPGGLSFDQAQFLISELVSADRKIIGFDLCEVAPGNNAEWNGNVGARILFHLAGATLVSHDKT